MTALGTASASAPPYTVRVYNSVSLPAGGLPTWQFSAGPPPQPARLVLMQADHDGGYQAHSNHAASVEPLQAQAKERGAR